MYVCYPTKTLLYKVHVTYLWTLYLLLTKNHNPREGEIMPHSNHSYITSTLKQTNSTSTGHLLLFLCRLQSLGEQKNKGATNDSIDNLHLCIQECCALEWRQPLLSFNLVL